MSYKLTWTGPTGPGQIVVEKAGDVLRESVKRHRMSNLVVTDDQGRKLKPDKLAALAAQE